MKYTIEGFSQAYALTLKKSVPVKDGKEKVIKIDFTDLVILRWFVDFYPNMRKMIVDGKEYAWLSHQKMLSDLPLLDISKRACIERMQKLVEFEILDYRFIKDGGTFSLYTFGKNYENMIGGEQSTEHGVCGQTTTGGTQPTEHGVCGQTDNKDNSIEDSSIDEDKSIKNTPKKKERKKPAPAPSSFDALIENYSKGNEEVRELLGEWLKVRKAKRAAMTDRAIELNLQKLDKLAEESNLSVTEYLKEIICRGWQAFYPINNSGNKAKSAPVPRYANFEARAAMERAVMRSYEEKETPKTAAEDESIRERAEALRRRFAEG